MKLSRINAISGDIVCTQQRDTQVVKKKKVAHPSGVRGGVGWLEDVKDQLPFPDASELSKPVCCSRRSRKLLKMQTSEENQGCFLIVFLRNRIRVYVQGVGGGGSGTLE